MSRHSTKWTEAFERASQSADNISSLLSDRENIEKNGGQTAKVTSDARSRINALTNDITALDNALSKMGQDPQAHGMTDRDITRRRDELVSLQRRKESLSHRLTQSSAQSSAGSTWGAGPSGETNATRGLDNGEILQMQNQMMRQQDEDLDMLSETIRRQKDIGMAIGDELDDQEELLGDLNAGMSKTRRQLKREDKKVRKLQISARDSGYICCVIFLILVFIALVASDFGCKFAKDSDRCQ
eukprot:TRINITY_DN520_c0_g2_i2.p1 TRINITY_DN520_c0_g2~~TRINITY_DN520_c0_g2_i2.p1  ORF type:complete len:242 (-),score=38.64 TRINITY_DN520_c0_g2_i2:142-867(-)